MILLPSILALLAPVVIAGGECVQPVSEVSEPPLRLFIDTSLNERYLRLVSISEEGIMAREENGKTVQLSRSEVLAVAPLVVRGPVMPSGTVLNVWRDPTLRDTEPLGRCDLVDGQVLPGRVWAAGSTSDALGWESRLWGHMSVPIEAVSVLTLRPGGSGRRDGHRDDVVWFVNGDRAGGFVSGISTIITLEADGKRTDFPAERIAGIGFANPPVAPQGTWIWLYDGTVAAVSSLRVTRDNFAFVEAAMPSMNRGPDAKLAADELRAIAFDAARMSPLASLPLSVASSQGRRWTPAPIVADIRAAPLGAADIELPGPMVAEWALPKGAARVSALCELPPTCRVWGDCELFVELSIGGETRPLWRSRINAGSPEVRFNVLLGGAGDGSRLRLRLDPGENGPIQDRLVIRRAVVLVGAE